MPNDRFRRTPEIVFETVGERSVLLDRSTMEMVTLNPVGSQVWEMLGEPLDVAELTARLHAEHPDIDTDRLRSDIDAFLAEMSAAGFVREDARD